MAITTDKLTTLAQLQLEAERIKQEMSAYAKSADLGSLAGKSTVAYSDLDAALQALISGKASFVKVDAVPDAATADGNVLYLVKNTTTGHYDIYAKVAGDAIPDTDPVQYNYTMELLDDTTVNLSGLIGLTDLSATNTGSGNAVTGVSYDNTTGVFTVNKGATFLTSDDVPVASDNEVTTMLNTVFAAAETGGEET